MDCRIPTGSLTVFSGVSGSGKSTLAFDTLYAEGQRRYVTSLSTYARQFLERLPRPDVDFVSNLPPAIAIERRNRVTNARATVGTATEILDLLRLLFARVGETICAVCGGRARTGAVEDVAERILDRWEGKRISVGAPLPARRGERAAALRERLLRDGYMRFLDEAGALVDVGDITGRELTALRRTGLLLIDRLALRRTDGRARLCEAVANAYSRAEGRCVVRAETGESALFRRGFACAACARECAPPEPALFSFNSPLGACPTCQGFGRVPSLDRERVVPDPEATLEEGAIAPFTTPSGAKMQRRLLRACEERGVAVDVPFQTLASSDREWIFEGDGRGWRGVQAFFRRLERKRYKVQARVMIARYRRFDTCPECGGRRLRPEALAVRVGGRDIAAVSALTLGEVSAWLDILDLDPQHSAIAGRLLEDLTVRVATACEVGLDYVTLDRAVRTLSGGEAQRIQLAAALGGTLTASLYVLDEPSVGLHARDIERLIGILRRVRDQGNTVVVVEHATEIVEAADHIVDLGPRAGRQGGRLLVEGSLAQVRAHADSLTGRALRGEFGIAARPTLRGKRAAPRGTPSTGSRRGKSVGRGAPRARSLRVIGASAHNLRDVTVDIPLGELVVVTGVSGAGKTSLVRSVLVANLRREPERGACERILGAEQISKVVVVDSTPPARSVRSNPATVSKAFEAIRRRFAATSEARALGVSAGWFSFNVAGGRCESCEGRGEVLVDMQFLDDVRMVCELCEGTRYREEAQAVRSKGLSIVDVLALTVDEALVHFADDPVVSQRLASLAEVGLGYIALGQPLSTLSSGETQRLRLATALREGGEGALFVLDEPTTGLHPADVEMLLGCLRRVLAAGGSAIVVEHNLDVIGGADHVIDLGPEAGPQGGRVVATGPPATIAACGASLTGAALRRRFNPE